MSLIAVMSGELWPKSSSSDGPYHRSAQIDGVRVGDFVAKRLNVIVAHPKTALLIVGVGSGGAGSATHS